MSLHLVGYETSASESALTAITPIPDGTVNIQGNDIRVPGIVGQAGGGPSNLAFAIAMINSATATLRAQLQSPSLRATLNFDIGGIVNGLVFGNLPPCAKMFDSPVPLVPTEGLDAFVQNGAAVMNRVFVELSDGPVKPVNGRMYTVRCTAAASAVTASWVNSSLTFGQVLPAGNYQVVGMKAWSANCVAARLFFVGSAWRPGVPMQNSETQAMWDDFRYGNIGVWDVFNNVTPPSVDIMGITDTAQVVFLDLIKAS